MSDHEMRNVTVALWSIWRQNNKRFERYVKVVGTAVKHGEPAFLIVRCSPNGGSDGGSTTVAKASRFGKAYKPVETAWKEAKNMRPSDPGSTNAGSIARRIAARA